MREADRRYFERLESQLESAFDVAERARAMGADPEPEVEIPTARDMADRVENILGIPGVAERVRELEADFSREEAALELVTDFVEGRVGDYDSRAGKIEGAVRTAVALLTEGVVAAPIEGIDRVELLENDDGTEFVNVYYAGPIRSAGGTAQALSVLVADYARSLLGVEEYRARDDEIERYAEEVDLYDTETGLQYSPKDAETRFIAEHMPIMLDGEATGDEEVSGYRDLERVDTNSARGGMCLVMAEGIALKAPKIQRYTGDLEAVDWPWLQDLIDGAYKEGHGDDADEEGDGADDEGDGKAEAGDGAGGDPDGPPRPDPSWKFLRDLIAGRPVFSHPSETGGFRLRYGRARNHGHATAGIHPATMHVVDDFLASGTQIKTERPGKAAGIVPVDSIEGPTVRLANGDVRRIDDPAEASEVANGVEKILDIGEYLVNYGEFVENNHPLAPAGYAVEWWRQEFADAGADVQALRDAPGVDLEHPSADEAIEWAIEYDAPLHPEYTHLWHDLTVGEFERLAAAVAAGRVETGPDGPMLVIARDGDDPATVSDADTTDTGERADGPRSLRAIVETLLVEHRQSDDELRIPDFEPLALSLGLEPVTASGEPTDGRVSEERAGRETRPEGASRDGERGAERPASGEATREQADDATEPPRTTDGGTAVVGYERPWDGSDLPEAAQEWPNAMEAVRAVAPFDVRERAPTRVGNRMGRPEKSEERELSPAVHTLFPIGEAGGSQRDVAAAAGEYDATDSNVKGELEVQVGRRECPDCGEFTMDTRCPDCASHTDPHYECPDCEQTLQPDDAGRVHCDRCEVDGTSVRTRTVDLNDRYRAALERVGERENAFDTLKAVKGLTSADKTPEPIEKGILRAKHDVSTFKDGTVRYDMTDLPVTAVRPQELDVSADRLRALGYEEDIHGDPLRHDDQLVELRVQDVVLSDGAAEHMLKTADFVDDLLESFYGLEPFYELDDREDLVGELVFGMAPHTSAATVGRVVGFTSAAVGYAHPYFHAAKRRNCFHPETDLHYEAPDGTLRTESVRAFVERHLDPESAETDDFGTLVSELDGELRVPSLDADGNRTREAVSAVSRHPAPDHLVEIVTEERELTVTPDHPMLIVEDGLVERAAHRVSVGDRVPVVDGGNADAIESEAVATDGGGHSVETVTAVRTVAADVEHTYCLTVPETNTVVADGAAVKQCDGDEDCVMLLMDGLLNFSRQYLPDQRGGSVAEDSRLLAVDPDGEVRTLTFDEFWKKLESPVETDGKFRKRTCYEEGWKTYTFDDDHEASLQPIEKAIRYRADEDEHLVRIETQFGREIEITEHHSLFRYDDGIEEVAGEELSAGDLIVAPQEFDIDPVETTIDAADAVDDPYVFIDGHVEDLLRTAWESDEHGGPIRSEFRSGLSYRLRKAKIRHEDFESILSAAGLEVPRDVSVGLEGSSDGIDREIEVDEKFGWLLGLFVAEGSTSSVCPAIHNADEELIDEAAEIIETTLGHEPGIRWSNRSYELRFPAVFREVLYDLGFENCDSYDSSEKVIPDAILRAPEPVVRAFLRGFIAGDGSDRTDDNVTTVAFHTTSDDVKDGIVFLLHRLGIVANVSERTDRDGNRQDIYTVTVSGGASDNPLHRALDGEDPYHPKSLVVRIPDALMDLREMEIEGIKQLIPKYLKRRDNVSVEKLGAIVDGLEDRKLSREARNKLDELRPLVDGDLSYLRVTDVERVEYDGRLYDLQVGGDPVFTANWLYAHNSMDAPLVMSSRIDPAEIDDEAHNVDVMSEYPREFYEATREMADTDDVEDVMTIAEESLGTESEYTGFDHTHDTTNIHMGPALSAYKTLGSMEEKMDAQLHLSRKLRAVDETDVAERIIEFHFLPDLIGNLRAFSRQETRCLDCGEKYRRMPLTGECRECGGDVNLTVHEGSVNKYMDTAKLVAEEFGARRYTKQRLEVLERALERTFEDDTNKASSLDDFM